MHSRLERSSNTPLLLGHRRARSKPHAYSASAEPKLRPNPLVLLVTIHVAARNQRRTPSVVEVGNIRRRRCRLNEVRPTCAGFLLALFGFCALSDLSPQCDLKADIGESDSSETT